MQLCGSPSASTLVLGACSNMFQFCDHWLRATASLEAPGQEHIPSNRRHWVEHTPFCQLDALANLSLGICGDRGAHAMPDLLVICSSIGAWVRGSAGGVHNIFLCRQLLDHLYHHIYIHDTRIVGPEPSCVSLSATLDLEMERRQVSERADRSGLARVVDSVAGLICLQPASGYSAATAC